MIGVSRQHFPRSRKTLEFPVYFPSVSSLKTNLPPSEYVGVLSELSNLAPQFLVSAFDVQEAGKEPDILEGVRRARDNGATVLLDSGNYESFWFRAGDRWKIEQYLEVLGASQYDIAFTFDAFEQSSGRRESAQEVIASWMRTQQMCESTDVCPIIHGNATDLPLSAKEIAAQADCSMIAVAERELGTTLLERLRAVRELRAALDACNRSVALHLLGTGNPSSIALFSLAGADSFDGLEWCQTVIDRASSTLHHLSHYEVFREQSGWSSRGLSPQTAVLAHNLDYFSDWLAAVRDHRLRGTLDEWIPERLDARLLDVGRRAGLL